MFKIKLLNKIAKVGTDRLNRDEFIVGEDIEDPDAIIVRSADMHNMEFGPSLRAIARAGAGVNNIPVEECSKRGIVVFNTPGANANGVKELTIAALLLASRDIVAGIEWVKSLKGQEGVAKLVEAGKSKFAGCEIEGKTLGVIGLGAIGGMVANAAVALGMEVIGYDPYITVDAAWGLSRAVRRATSYDEVYAAADYITIHAPATNETKGMICAESIAKMKDGVRIINLSRADLVNSADIIAALASGKVKRYVTDFPTDELVGMDGVIAIPHLGASTVESEDNCAVMAVKQVSEYLKNGNIINSVNYPNTSMPHDGDARICVLHANKPHMLSQFSAAVSAHNINIENMINRSRGDYAYTIIELIGEVPSQVTEKITSLDGVYRVNIIK
ncbi:MAG TPA: phosphoglycerate dehydrogenase [Bacillota bacterium]|nr:phosphoglycerate dehydrogenase [Clostridiales bacterium]HPT84450.1 phosphoglycerate dehydrogenase [Bacillota bacterium]